MERVSRKEKLPYERAREECISTLERIYDQTRTGGFSSVELFLANGDDRFDLGVELRVRNDSGGFATNTANVALVIPFVSLEMDVLWSQIIVPPNTLIRYDARGGR